MDDATIFSGLIIRALSHLEIVRVGYLAITYGVKSLLIFFFIFFIKGYEVTKVTGVTGVTLAIKGSFPHQIQGYRVASLLNFSLNILLIKGYEVTKVTRVTGVTMALHQGVLSSSNLRLRGYRVTNRLNFFFNFLE